MLCSDCSILEKRSYGIEQATNESVWNKLSPSVYRRGGHFTVEFSKRNEEVSAVSKQRQAVFSMRSLKKAT
jgi:hypothetical protein